MLETEGREGQEGEVRQEEGGLRAKEGYAPAQAQARHPPSPPSPLPAPPIPPPPSKDITHLRDADGGFPRRYEREIAAGIRKPVRMGDANLSLKDAAEDDADMDMGLVPVLDLPLVEGRVVKPIRRKDGTRQIVTAEFA